MKYKVQLKDLRVKEFTNKKDAEAYCEASGGQIVKKVKKLPLRQKLKQFWERS